MGRKRAKPYDKMPEGSEIRHVYVLIEKLREYPRFAVVCAHSFIELMVTTLIHRRCKNGRRIADDQRTYSHATRLVILSEAGFMPDPLFQQLDYLRKLRNECGHNPVFEVTDGNIEKFASLGFRLVPEDAFEEGRTVWLLWSLIGQVWNLDADLFSKEFWPAS